MLNQNIIASRLFTVSFRSLPYHKAVPVVSSVLALAHPSRGMRSGFAILALITIAISTVQVPPGLLRHPVKSDLKLSNCGIS
jgi:hypothetical protein